MKYTYYVVMNNKGEYLTFRNHGGDHWHYDYTYAELMEEYVTAEWRATKYGGKVKKVTITVEED